MISLLNILNEAISPLPTTRSTGETPISMWIVRIAIVISDVNGLDNIKKRNQILKTIKTSIEKKGRAYDYNYKELDIESMIDSFKYYPKTDKMIGIVPKFLFKGVPSMKTFKYAYEIQKISSTIEIKQKK
jgi:hypothetical protein